MTMAHPTKTGQGRQERSAVAYGELVSQYLELRNAHPGVVLLFRVGTFYEVLFDDAEVVARELGLKLSERPSGGQAEPVPQCGFAAHALDTFLPRLLARGYRVAVCEETEADASGRSSAPLGRADAHARHGHRSGTAIRRTGQPIWQQLSRRKDTFGLAWTDLSTGEFKAGEFDLDGLAGELQRLQPAEVLVPAGLDACEPLARWNRSRPAAPPERSKRCGQPIQTHSYTICRVRKALPGLIVQYVTATQGAAETPPDAPEPISPDDAVQLDAATQRHLELAETERRREREGSLLNVLDRARTPMGRRAIREWLLRPLVELSKIRVRQAIVAELLDYPTLRASLTEALLGLPDVERLAGRAAAFKASAEDLRVLAGLAEQLAALAPATSSARTAFLQGLSRPRLTLTQFAAHALRCLPMHERSILSRVA